MLCKKTNSPIVKKLVPCESTDYFISINEN